MTTSEMQYRARLEPPDFDVRQALCTPDRAALFLATTRDAARAGKAVCQQCPIRRACLAYALRTHQVGVWGGTCDGDRARMRRSRVKRAVL